MFSFLAKLKAETLVGLLIISGVGLVIYSAIRVTGLKDFKGEGNIIHAYFDDVAGLSPQTAVRIAGIKVGRIESISLDGNRAKVSMLIFSGYQIPVDSNAIIKSLGLLGDKYVEIATGFATIHLQDGETIATQNAKGLENAIENLTELSASLKRIAEKNESDIRELIFNLKIFSEELKIIASRGNLGNSLANLESITAKIDEGKGTLGQLINDEDTIEKLNIALDDIGNLIGSASRWQYDVSFEGDYLGTQGVLKSNFGVKIKTQKDRFYQFKLTNHPFGKIENKTTFQNTTDASGNVTTTTTEEAVKTEDYLLSLQIAKRFYDTQFKIGIFEDTFGVGIEQFFGLKDRWRFFTEAWDFGRKELAPQSVLGGSYRVAGGLHLNFGVHDMFHKDSEKRDYFLGLKLEFREDDLNILGAGAVTGAITK